MSAAGPCTTVKAPRTPVVSPVAAASIVTDPIRTPVIVFVANPPAAVAVPVPVTVPAPDCLAKLTTLVLSEVTVFPAASWIVAVSTRVEPEARFAVEPVRATRVAAPWTTVNDQHARAEPRRRGFHDDRTDESAGDRLGRDTCGDGRGAGAGDAARPGLLGEVDDGGAVRGRVPGGVLDRGGEDAGGAGGEKWCSPR